MTVRRLLAPPVAKVWWRAVRALSERRELLGVTVWVPQPTPSERHAVETKLGRALELIAAHDARILHRLRRLAAGIIVVEHRGSCGAWLRAPSLIRLSTHHLVDPATEAEHLAATLTHETMHAWLESRGFRYEASHRHRIEAVCYRSEARLADRLPGGAALAQHSRELADRALETGPSPWSWEVAVEADIRELEELGMPRWIRDIVRRVALRRSV